MTCPDCGYIMTAFDKECPRCQKYSRAERSCPHCGTVNMAPAPACKRCGYSFQPKSTSAQGALKPPKPPMPLVVSLPPANETDTPLRVAPEPPPAEAPLRSQEQSSPAPSTPMNAEMLACRMCGNTNGQKLTAICRAGSWTTQSRGYAVGMGGDGYGHSVVVGGPTASTTHGQTAIARLLLPPNRPFFRPSRIGSVLVPIAGLFCCLVAASAGPWAATVAVLLTSGLWFVVLLREGQAAATGLPLHTLALAQWEQSMQVWQRLFYCSRCDHVYDPQEGTAAAPHAMTNLLLTRDGEMRPAREMPDNAAAVKAAVLAFGTGLLLLVVIWVISLSQQREAQEEAQHITALRAPLLMQYQAALPQADAAIAAAGSAVAADAANPNAGSDYTHAEKVSSLSSDLSTLKDHRDSAQQGLDNLEKDSHALTAESDASQSSTEISGMVTSCQTVAADLQALGHPAAAFLPAAASPEASPGAGYSITTQAGGGAPPNPDSLPR